MNNRQNINLPYRPRNPRFSQNRNQRPFIRPQAQHNETRIHQRNQNDDRYNFPSTSPSNFADQSVADQNIHHAYEHGSVAMYSSFPVMQNNQLINQPRIRHPNPQTWPRTSVPDPQFGTNVTGTNMQHGHDGTQIMPSIQPTHIDSGLHQQLDNSSMRREMVTSTPSFGNAAFSNTIQPSMQNQYIDHNNFTLQPDTCNIIPQNVGNNKELYFPKVQHNQSQQVKIPGLDLCPDNTDQAPFIQDQHHPVLKQGQESSMQNVEHTGLMSFPLQSEPMRDNRQQNYMGFQDIQTSQVGRFQSPNLSSPMMSLPTPPVPFLQQDSITQPMNNRIPTPITQQNFQFERLPNSNMFPPSQGSAPMQQYPRQPSQLKTFTSEPRFQSVSQPYHDQSRGMLTQFPPMQQNMKPPLEDNLKPRDYKISPMTGKEMDMQWIHSWLIRKGKQKMKEEMPLKADTNVRIVCISLGSMKYNLILYIIFILSVHMILFCIN